MSTKRIDPDDGNAYAFDELRAFYKGKYKQNEIAAYWETCKPAKREKKGKAEPEGKAKAKVKAKAKAKTKTSPEYKAKTELYTNPICPFAHRAVFAAALCKLEPKVIMTPLSGQVKMAELLGVEHCGEWFKSYESADKLSAFKEDYKKTTNASGEVPTVKTPKGDIILESEICAEYFDASSRGHRKLLPPNPVLAAKVRLAMKRFNDVVPTLYGLLTNQDPAADAEKAKTLTEKLGKFVEAIDKDATFCFGDKPTLADVHCGPFLFRFHLLLDHYRDFGLFKDQPFEARLTKLLSSIEALPEFQKLTPISKDQLQYFYRVYANGFKWSDKPTLEQPFAGRGQSKFGK